MARPGRDHPGVTRALQPQNQVSPVRLEEELPPGRVGSLNLLLQSFPIAFFRQTAGFNDGTGLRKRHRSDHPEQSTFMARCEPIGPHLERDPALIDDARPHRSRCWRHYSLISSD